MFTLNWYKHIANVMASTVVNKYKTIKGTEYDMITGASMDIGSASTITSGPHMGNVLASLDKGTGGVVFGTGTTPPTIEDYKLAGEVITGVSATAKITREADDNGITLTGLYTIVNNGDAEITVCEIGIVSNMHPSYSTWEHSQYKGLIERTVLDSPVTIPAGGVGQVTYTVRMVYPSD